MRRYAVARWEKKVCVVPHSRQMKWSESRRDHGFGVSQTVQSVTCCANGRSQWSHATGIPAA